MSKNVYNERREYINTLKRALEPLQDFGSIQYGYESVTNGEFIKISSIFGETMFLDVTALSTEQILKEVCKVVIGEMPEYVIGDMELKRRIVPLFEQKHVYR